MMMTRRTKSHWRAARWWEGKGNGRGQRGMLESWRTEKSCLSNKERVEERWSMEGKGRDVSWPVLWDEGGGA